MLDSSQLVPWLVLAVYAVSILAITPRRVNPAAFFAGHSASGAAPGLWVLVASATISWIMAKSIDNAAALASKFGLVGGIGYALYYLGFVIAGLALFVMRVRGGHASLPGFLAHKYGGTCARLFLIAIFIRLYNEVWSNTKVYAQYFGPEGSMPYWLAVAAVTVFTVYYSWGGGLRSSLVTDVLQMILAALLLGAILWAVSPAVLERGLPIASAEQQAAGLTFCGLALVQLLSYPFHDPVLTDRAFITSPRVMLLGFLLSAFCGGLFILLFSSVGLYALGHGIPGNPSVAVPAVLGGPLFLVVNAIMLTSAGSTLDSTFASTAKLSARDWPATTGQADDAQVRWGRRAILAIALFGNVPLLTYYLDERSGPAVIAATTISGTMVMGLAPIILLGWLPRAGATSFHLAFWPGIAVGAARVIEGLAEVELFPVDLELGSGGYARDLGLNCYGLVVCTTGFLLGTLRPDRTRDR